MMTTWLVLIILAIGIIWLINKKSRKKVAQQSEHFSTRHIVRQQPAVNAHDDDRRTNELIAVIVTTVAEFTGLHEDEFNVLRIR